MRIVFEVQFLFLYLQTRKDVSISRKNLQNAKVAQLVEHDLAKVGVAGSNPVFRSNYFYLLSIFFDAWMVELVDTQDLKSCDP